MALSVVEREYLKLLKPELAQAIQSGDPNRAATFARELAKLRRKSMKLAPKTIREGGHNE